MFLVRFPVFKIALLLVFIMKTNSLYAQEKAYFQQKVDYKIDVSLDDVEHFLRGNIELKYTNNSTDTLSYIYMHLWANGYKHQQTAFGKQLLDNGRLDFHFSKKKDRGFMDSLSFVCDDEPIRYEEEFLTPDIAKLKLPKPILPNQTVTIKTPFRVKIPEDFSRLAHVDQAYMFCQWYPKPAVYDKDGWHPMPYIDQGEFFSEFGSFDVSITLPQNYVVGATGDLQTASEKEFLENRAEASKKLKFDNWASEKDTFPTSSEALKTIRYTADKVHDFAWFADKRYFVQKDTIQLSPNRVVDSYVFFNRYEARIWKNAMNYTKRAVKFYSNIVGEYPYNAVTVVQGIYHGCDMEYPMITVIGRAGYGEGLDNVITHEVGHNWFYGILGSNERDHPWMDEGWNTYMDARYMSTYYEYATNNEYLAYLYEAKQRSDQAIESRSQDLSSINYYICAYGKPTMAFRYLQQYLGTEEFDRILKIYYETWKFKHPSPQELRAVFEKEATKEVAWFFDNVINSTKHIDYATQKMTCCNQHNKMEIHLKNKGKVNAPFSLTSFDNEGNMVERVWIEPFAKDTIIEVQSEKASAAKIDAEEEMPEYNRNDNIIRTYGLIKKGERLKVQLLADFAAPQKPRINILPLIGFNFYDGVMIGAAIYNLPVPKRQFEYVVMPFFSTFALAPSGMAEFRMNKFIKNHRITEGISFKTYHKHLKRYTDERPYAFSDRYYKITPFVEFELGKKSDISQERHLIRFTHSLIIEERGQETRLDTGINAYYVYLGDEITWRSTHRLSYYYENKQKHAPLNLLAMLEYANYDDLPERAHYIKLSLEANFKIMYSKLWGLDLRIFTGGFLFHTDRRFGAMPLQLIAGNRGDYHYDDHIMGRRETENALSQQVSLREGGFKTAIEPISGFASSNAFVFAINIKSDIPIKLPFRTKYLKLKPFLDLGYYKNTAPATVITSPAQEIFISGGFMLDIWDGAAAVYLPLFGTDNLENAVKSFSGNEFYKRITFSFNLSRLRPEEVVKEILF